MDFSGIDLTIVVPIWKRTHNLPRLYESVAATVPQAQVLMVVNSDDEQAKLGILDSAILLRDCEVLVVDWPGGSPGDYGRKINAGYRASDRDCIFLGADDIVFRDGWYEMARPLLDVEPAMNPTRQPVGVVGTVDACNDRTMRGEHATHSLVARWYADLGGSVDQHHMIYDEGYDHEYCDDELVQTAMVRGAYAHAFGSLVEHMHPNVGKAPMDETYERGRQATRRSRNRYFSRQHLWQRGVRRVQTDPMQGARRRG